ncbi:MAG: AroM family protein [Ignavibacteriales bacterium]
MKTRRLLGTLTIGQSPRVDLIPEIKTILGDDVEVIEEGALDGLTLEEVKGLHPAPGDYVLVTRMAGGTAVKIAEKHILPRMQEGLNRLVERGAEIISLVCTGEFPPFNCDRLVVKPQRLLYNVASAVAAGSKLGVIMPDVDQIPQGTNRWTRAAAGVLVEAASPYGEPEALDRAAHSLKDWGAGIVVMDCFGYTLAMKDKVKGITGAPVILARSILARVLRELL